MLIGGEMNNLNFSLFITKHYFKSWSK